MWLIGVGTLHIKVAKVVTGFLNTFEGVHEDLKVLVAYAYRNSCGVGEISLECCRCHFKMGIQHLDMVFGSILISQLWNFCEVKITNPLVAMIDS